MAQPKISLEQWRALTAVVEVGGYAQAAEALNKTQSTITYAVQKIESLLGLKIFEIQGRKAQLTREGERSEEHTSELQSLMRISYAVFRLKKKNRQHNKQT